MHAVPLSLDVLPLAAWREQLSPDPAPAALPRLDLRELYGPPRTDAALLEAAGLGEDDGARVAAILCRNFAGGRAARIMQRMSAAELALAPTGPGADPDEARRLAYRRRVVQTYAAERERLLALEAGEDAAWAALERQLERSALRILTQHGVRGAYAADRAAELAQQACVLIFRATYPCDVAFDAWSHIVLRNVVHAARSRSHDVLDRGAFVRSLDEMQENADGDEVGAAAGRGGFQPCGGAFDDPFGAEGGPGSPDMQALIEAILQMRSANRRAVLVYTYFQGLDDGEIAEKLGRNRDGVQVLRHRALRQLRELVVQQEE